MGLFKLGKSDRGRLPHTPIEIFDELRPRTQRVQYLWSHQHNILGTYTSEHSGTKDLALELPTGAGKTLVGLLIAEFRRRSRSERVVYLCPTRQLAYQVAEQADNFGIDVSVLVGPGKDYDATAFTQYQRAERIAISTYSSIFNAKPRINDPEAILCDDAHAADNAVLGMWSLEINKVRDSDFYWAVIGVLGNALPLGLRRTRDQDYSTWIRTDSELIPLPLLHPKSADLRRVLENYCSLKNEHKYAWHRIAQHLNGCNLYVSTHEIHIRPLVPPTETHAPFADAKQRIYMSATLSSGGDLERMWGVPRIDRIPAPEGWDSRSTGRRLILFPACMEKREDATGFGRQFFQSSDRTLAIFPSKVGLEALEKRLPDGIAVLHAEDIESSLEPFLNATPPATLLLANRYDGIDLPGDTCRRLALAGMPGYGDLHETFLTRRLGAYAQFRDRLRTRITQGLGRCTREKNDYAVVLIHGDEFLKWCSTKRNTRGLNPELQAEIEFGLDNSAGSDLSRMVELQTAFLNQSDEWVEADAYIEEERKKYKKESEELSEVLHATSRFEIDYQLSMWNGEFSRAYEIALKIVDKLSGGSELKPYRGFWHYQASVAAFLEFKRGEDVQWRTRFNAKLQDARASFKGNTWLAGLDEILPPVPVSGTERTTDPFPVLKEFEKRRIVGRNFDLRMDEIRLELHSEKAKIFESGLVGLGNLLGFDSVGFVDRQGAPDALWTYLEKAVVFEAKSEKKAKNAIFLADVREALTHRAWLVTHGFLEESMPTETVLVSSSSTIAKEAEAVADTLKHVDTQQLRALFEEIRHVLGSIQGQLRDLGEEEQRELIRAKYLEANLDHQAIVGRLCSRPVRHLEVVGTT